MKITKKIARILREYIFILSILIMTIGTILLVMGVIYIWFKDLAMSTFAESIGKIADFNYYVFVGGIIILGIGVSYLYGFLKRRKFLLEEIRTNKRSELIKRHAELKENVKFLPFKYKKMLADKERELKMK